MGNRFTEKAKQLQATSGIMNGRTKMSVDDVIRTYPNGITVNGFEFLTGKKGVYVVITIAENPDIYINGGKCITDIATAWVDDFDGDITGANKELVSCGGARFKLTRKKTKSGDDFIVYTPID